MKCIQIVLVDKPKGYIILPAKIEDDNKYNKYNDYNDYNDNDYNDNDYRNCLI